LSERSGIGAVQVAILESVANGAGPDFRSNEKILSQAEPEIGLAPWYAYPVLVAQPWKMPVTLIEDQGNFGSRGNDPAASRRYTESRLTDAGRVAQVRDQLTRVYGVYAMMYVALPRSLPDTIRQWVRTNRTEDLPTSLTSLESAILSQPSPRY
jgi:DNA gyrase/topoisomerase IV, subunit A